MNLPLELRRRAEPLPATGLYVRAVADVVAALGTPLPEVYALSDGFLLRRGEPLQGYLPGALRLRELAPHCFVPVDADLSPALLDDEARSLVRERGLVFLPGGTVLAYDRHAPIALADLVAVGPVTRDEWSPLPQGSRLAERIRVLIDDRPTPTVETILQQSAGELASEEPARPPEATSTGGAIWGNLRATCGNFFVWLGRLLNWRWLAERGASLLRGAMQAVPRLAENLLGRQQAALRELLREFREGDPEQALRRALPISTTPGRGNTTAGDANLPTHNLRFHLGDLLASSGGGSSVWLTDAQIQWQLAEEYRRAARAAAEAGDYRRAAFIYGKLLGDLRLAADMLARGGMWQEAAVLYLERVNDEISAARCFEQAGDIDRALTLYRKNKAHVEAGDVLRRAGDDDAARAEYLAATGPMVAQGRHADAGDLFRDHVHDIETAATFYQMGWDRHSTACVLRLLDVHAQTNDRAALLALAREAADHYQEAGAESEAVQVFNALVRLGEQTLPPVEREELRDRALVGLAHRLRQHAATDQRSGGTVSLLLGRDGVWNPNVVADAEVAYRGELRKSKKPTTTPHTVVHLGHGQPTAAAGSMTGEALFLGFEDGEVVRFTPETGAVVRLEQRHRTAIESMGADERGSVLALVVGDELTYHDLSHSPAHISGGVFPPTSVESGLLRTSNLVGRAGEVQGIRWGPTEYRLFTVPRISPPTLLPRVNALTTGAALLQLVSRPHRRLLALRFSHDKVEASETSSLTDLSSIGLGGVVPPPAHRIMPIEVRLLPHPEDGTPRFSVLDIDDMGRLWIADLRWLNRLHHLGSFHTRTGGFLAGTLLGPTQAVGVQADGVVWLRRDGRDLLPWSVSMLPLEDAVAVWVGWQASEVIVVRRRGDLVRVPRPR